MPQLGAFILAVTILLLSSGSLCVSYGQKRAPRSANTARPSSGSSQEDQWWAAQRSIEAAIQQLETYLREAPNGNREATARQQIAGLRDLSITASRPEWQKLDYLRL